MSESLVGLRAAKDGGMPERVVGLSEEVSRIANDKVERIKVVTHRTKMLAMNALIEAAHAGERGKGFAVVANEVGKVSEEIKSLSDSLTEELTPQLEQLTALGRRLVEQVRGGRLADLALNMIDVIDRNLYERSCDVRWWATDSAVVDACVSQTASASAYASRRLGVILDSYTVYLDLWIANKDGIVIANGRPDRYGSVIGTDVSGMGWFRKSLATADGSEYAVDDVTTEARLNGAAVATYATAVRKDGEADGEIVGVLGIFFDWAPQAQGIVASMRLNPEEQDTTRAFLVDSNHRIIASSDGAGVFRDEYPLDTSGGSIGYYTAGTSVVGYALTPGYETYEGLGWYGVVEQRTQRSAGGSSAS